MHRVPDFHFLGKIPPSFSIAFDATVNSTEYCALSFRHDDQNLEIISIDSTDNSTQDGIQAVVQSRADSMAQI